MYTLGVNIGPLGRIGEIGNGEGHRRLLILNIFFYIGLCSEATLRFIPRFSGSVGIE